MLIRVGQIVRHALRLLALASAVACSEKAALPAQIPECDAGKMCGSTGGQGTGAGTGTGGGGDSGGSCGQLTFSSQLCNTCVRASCCDVNARCSASADCVALFNCVSACSPNDTACRTACRDRLQNAIAAYDNFVGCKDLACGTDCAGSDAGSACGDFNFQGAACNTCMTASCCSQKATCSNNADCFALLQCASACPRTDQLCVSDCRAQHPNGAADYTVLNQCGLTNCMTQCQ